MELCIWAECTKRTYLHRFASVCQARVNTKWLRLGATIWIFWDWWYNASSSTLNNQPAGSVIRLDEPLWSNGFGTSTQSWLRGSTVSVSLSPPSFPVVRRQANNDPCSSSQSATSSSGQIQRLCRLSAECDLDNLRANCSCGPSNDEAPVAMCKSVKSTLVGREGGNALRAPLCTRDTRLQVDGGVAGKM